MYPYQPARSQRSVFQGIMVRKARLVLEWLSKNLVGTERASILPDSNWLGFHVGIVSERAKELFLSLHRDVFSPGFPTPKPELDGSGAWTAWFGYLEPWEPSMPYIPMPQANP